MNRPLTPHQQLEAIQRAFSGVGIVFSRSGVYLNRIITGEQAAPVIDGSASLVGKDLQSIFSPANARNFQSVIDRALETDEIQTVEYELDTQAGRRWFDATVTPITDLDDSWDSDHDATAAVLWFAEDVTERKKRAQDLQLFREILDEAMDAIYVVDTATGELVYVTRTGAERLGYDREQLLDLAAWDVTTAFDGPVGFTSVGDSHTGGFSALETHHVRADETTIPVEVSATDVECGSDTYRIVISKKRCEQRMPFEYDLAPDESPTVGVVRACSEMTDIDPLELPPLGNAIDPDTLDHVYTQLQDDAAALDGSFSFSYNGYEVTVHSTGTIELTESDEAS